MNCAILNCNFRNKGFTLYYPAMFILSPDIETVLTIDQAIVRRRDCTSIYRNDLFEFQASLLRALLFVVECRGSCG